MASDRYSAPPVCQLQEARQDANTVSESDRGVFYGGERLNSHEKDKEFLREPGS